MPKGGRRWVSSASLNTSSAAASLRAEGRAVNPDQGSVSAGRDARASVRKGHIPSACAWYA